MMNFPSLDKEKNLIIFLILFSFIIRIPVLFVYGDTNLEQAYEWRFLVENLIVYNKLVYQTFGDFLLPNLWMPPLYAYYLYIFSFLGFEEQYYIKLILFSQVFLASISVFLFYKISKNFFSKNISFFGAVLFSFFPLHIYASSQLSSITLQIFLYMNFFYFFFKLKKENKFSTLIIFSIISGLILLLRNEFQAIFALSIIYLFYFYKIPIKKILFIILISVITISPYLIRNYLIFEKITLVETFGYNLWKGSHPYAIKNSLVEGAEIFDEYVPENTAKEVDGFIVLDNVEKDKFYRFNFNDFFLDQAIKNIKKEPVEYIVLSVKKFLSFIFIDINSTAPNYYNPFHYIPVLLIGITSLLGIILSNKKSQELNYLILIFFIFVLIFSTVSILPRYKLIILPLQIIFTNIFIEYIGKKFLKKTE